MEVFYDLAKSPPTHDFVNWLSRVEEERIKSGAESLKVRIVPGQRFYSVRDKFYSPERRHWRIQNLLIPLAYLLPSVSDAAVGRGEQKHSYFNPGCPRPVIFKAPKLASEIVANVIRKNTVTITLRDSDFEPQRNTNLEEWLRVAGWLKQNGFNPIFVLDAEADMRGCYRDFPFPSYGAASYCPALRLALYEQAEMNLMTNSGVFVMALHSNVRMMAFKLFVDGVPCCSESHMRKSGFSPDHDWGPDKHLFWEYDDYRNIVSEFRRVTNLGQMRTA